MSGSIFTVLILLFRWLH